MTAIEKITKQIEVAKKVQDIANKVDSLHTEAALAHATAQILRDQGRRQEAEVYGKVIEKCAYEAAALQEEAESLQAYYVQNLMF